MLRALIRRERYRTLSHRWLPWWAVMEPTVEPPLGWRWSVLLTCQKKLTCR